MNDTSRALSALNSIDPSCSREEWVKIIMAAKAADLSFENIHDWSKNGTNYKSEKDCLSVWKSIKETGYKKRQITEKTLFYFAMQHGWRDPSKSHTSSEQSYQKNDEYSDNREDVGANNYASSIWNICIPVESSHGYIVQKQGETDDLRVYPHDAPSLPIDGRNMAGYLVIPCFSISNGMLQTLQFISPSDGKKLNLPNTSFNDGYFAIGHIVDKIYICEAIGQSWSIYQASGIATVMCFSASRMMTVAKTLREKYPEIDLIIVPDKGKEKEAHKIADMIGGKWIELPQDKPSNYDANDYALEHGYDALAELLCHAKTPEMPLNIIFADMLPEVFVPPDELIEGVLTVGDGSILYGDSNSGKTFFVIDMACAIARGVEWFGRKTESGLVIYLAAESPASVRGRLQAYQKHYDIRIPNFAIVQSPIDLFDGEADTEKLIHVIRLLEKQCEQKARFIVGDTLARLSAGANESAGQDMGLVIRHFDRIRNECYAHFMLIHHSGKNAAAGARGWSGVRAAVDTEIEVTASPSGRCAEITKQRDLGTKGDRIGFKLEPVTLGLTKWKSPATSCVVVPADAPPKSNNKRLSEVAGAIMEHLSTCTNPIKKRDLVKHFDGRYDSSAVYRELRKLVNAGAATDYMGSINLVRTGANK